MSIWSLEGIIPGAEGELELAGRQGPSLGVAATNESSTEWRKLS